MNIFRNRDAFVGQGEATAFSAAWEEFLALSERLRRELGERKYHLDRYLVLLFKMRDAYNTRDAMDEGDDLFSVNYQEAKREKEEQQFTPMFSEEHTRIALCAAMLAGSSLRENIGDFLQQQHVRLASRCDSIALNQYYERLCAFLGREEDMMRLNDLFVRCFLSVRVSTVFLEGYITELVGALLTRDAQTDHTVLQLLLDHRREVS